MGKEKGAVRKLLDEDYGVDVDWVPIDEAFSSLSSARKIIITTEKDAIRLRGLTGDLPVYVLPVKVAFHPEGDMEFDKIIDSAVRENISFLSKLSIWS